MITRFRRRALSIFDSLHFISIRSSRAKISIAVSHCVAPKDVLAGLCVIELSSLVQEADYTSEKNPKIENQKQSKHHNVKCEIRIHKFS